MFTVDLPITRESLEAFDEKPVEMLQGNGELVLVVDDDPALRAAADRLLRDAGYRVQIAEDGLDGGRLLDELGSEVDVIFTDAVMPGGGGVAVIQRAREVAPTAAVILTSGYIDEASCVGKTLLEDRAVLWKPYTPTTLLRAIRRALDEPARSSPILLETRGHD